MLRKLIIVNKRGLKLSAILSLPKGKHQYPVIILLQGFLGKKDGKKITSLSTHLTNLGFATIRFDYAGYGESEGEPDQEYLISNILTDISYVLKTVKTHKRLNNTKIGVWGQSMGGMLAIISASLEPDITAVCAVSAPAQITKGDDLEKLLPEWKEKGFIERKNSNGDLIKISYDFVQDARRWNAEKSVKKLSASLLIVLGKKDETVPPKITKNIYKAANRGKKLVEINNMPHEYGDNVLFITKINQLSGNFFTKTLK